jgi:hypothetical protein
MLTKHRSLSTYRKLIAATIFACALLGAATLFSPGVGQVSAQESRFPLDSVVATTTGLNLRDQPAITGAAVATLPVNARATVIGGPFNDSWYWLNFNGVTGYANGKYLALVDENYTPVPEVTASASVSPTAQGSPAASPSVTAAPGTTPQADTTATPTIPVPTTKGDYTGLWLGEMSQGGNVRSGPGLDKPVMKGWWTGRRVLLYEAAQDSKGGVWYRVSEAPEAPMWVHSSLIRKVAPVKFENARWPGKWVNVNLSQQVITAYEGGKPVMVSLTSTGTSKHPTNVGVQKIYWRLPKQTMEGGNLASGDYYKLKDVPYPQYFNSTGEALHGTYWHDNFGRPMSHGCVNLSIPISGWFYGWAGIGTVVYVHN